MTVAERIAALPEHARDNGWYCPGCGRTARDIVRRGHANWWVKLIPTAWETRGKKQVAVAFACEACHTSEPLPAELDWIISEHFEGLTRFDDA